MHELAADGANVEVDCPFVIVGDQRDANPKLTDVSWDYRRMLTCDTLRGRRQYPIREAPVANEETPGKPKSSGQDDPEATESGAGPSSRPLRAAGESGPPPRVTNMNIPVGEIRQNLEVVVVSVTHDKLVGHIESFARGHLREFRIRQLLIEAAATLGIALALGVPLFTATFKSFGSFSAPTLKIICGGGAIAAFLVAMTRFSRGVMLAFRHSTDYKRIREVVQAIEEDRIFRPRRD